MAPALHIVIRSFSSAAQKIQPALHTQLGYVERYTKELHFIYLILCVLIAFDISHTLTLAAGAPTATIKMKCSIICHLSHYIPPR